MTNAVQYVSIYLFNKSITIHWSSQAMHFHRQKERKKKIIQSTNRALFNLIIILLLSNLTYAFSAQDSESPAWSRWATSRYIYIYIYTICIWLVYTTDTVPLGFGSVCHNSTFVRLLLVYQFILNSNSNG